eukprot:779143-Rhodomonas_salina.1
MSCLGSATTPSSSLTRSRRTSNSASLARWKHHPLTTGSSSVDICPRPIPGVSVWQSFELAARSRTCSQVRPCRWCKPGQHGPTSLAARAGGRMAV